MRDIYVYGSIGDRMDETDSTSARQFLDQLRDAGGDDVTVHVNSMGGDVFEAHAMSEALRSYAGRSTCSIEGLAASAASFFALCADEVVMNPSALLMVHNPSTFLYGNAADFRERADLLDKIRDTIVGQYTRKTGKPDDEVRRWMDEETWFDAGEAVDAGFVDRLTDAEPVAAMLSPVLARSFAHFPSDRVKPAGAGECGPNIPGDGNGATSEAGAAEDCAGAAHLVVCVKGLFLNA